MSAKEFRKSAKRKVWRSRLLNQMLGAAVIAMTASAGSIVLAKPVATTLPAFAVSTVTIDGAVSPMGLGNAKPNIAWVVGARAGARKQVAYQLQVASSAGSLRQGKADIWDSGRINGSLQRTDYTGPALDSRRRYVLRVRVWDENGVSGWSQPMPFEMGLLAAGDVRGRWIRAGGIDTIAKAYAGHYFRREFELPGAVKSARLYFSATGMLRHCLNRPYPQSCRVAAGIVVPTINGAALSDRQLDSAPVSGSRALYTVLDVTRSLRAGRNVIGLSTGGDSDLFAQLEVTLTDGRAMLVATDDKWRTRVSPSIYVDRFKGVIYDARTEATGWDTPSYKPGLEWQTVEDSTTKVGPVKFTSDATLPPMRITKRWTPLRITKTYGDTYTIDFGQNIAGRAHFKLRGLTGQEIVITHAERLNTRGQADKFSTGFLGFQTDKYTFGNQLADWTPQFSYYGFRHVTISGLKAPPKPGEIWAEEVHTDLELTGSFDSGSTLINRIHRAAIQTTLNNAHGIPEDCPSREKRGWTADGYVSSPQAYANLDMEGFYRKWMMDIRDSQRPSGAGTELAPAEISSERDADSLWGIAIVEMPWELYEQTGDLGVLRDSYDSMRRFVDWGAGKAKGYILPPDTLGGDWAAAKKTNDPLLRTGMWYASVRQVASAARLLGRNDDAARYDKLGDAIRDAFNASFLDPTTGIYGAPGNQTATTSQVSYAIPLAFGMVPDDVRPLVIKNFVGYIDSVSKRHVESGLSATRYVLEALRVIDRPDLFHALVSQPDMPGWAHMLEKGPGTLWESWDGGSYDHAWSGSVDAYFYKVYAGINRGEAGFRTVTIKPFVPSDMAWARASQATPYGKVTSEWRKAAGALEMQVTVPFGSTGTIVVPIRRTDQIPTVLGPRAFPAGRTASGVSYQVGPGTYKFRVASW